MRVTARDPLPLFRSETQAAILAALFVDDQQEACSVSTLAERIHRPLPSVHREVKRLTEAGIISSEKRGNTRLVQPRRESPYYEPLRDLMMRSAGPVTVLSAGLSRIDGIEAAYLFGSWAKRAQGEPTEAPGDIDLLVIGSPAPEALYDGCASAEEVLGIDVNPVTVSLTDWHAPSTEFVRRLRRQVDEGSLVPLDASPDR